MFQRSKSIGGNITPQMYPREEGGVPSITIDPQLEDSPGNASCNWLLSEERKLYKLINTRDLVRQLVNEIKLAKR